MPRTPAKVTQADVARVLRAMQQTGALMRLEITPEGVIRLEPADAPKRAVEYKGQIRL